MSKLGKAVNLSILTLLCVSLLLTGCGQDTVIYGSDTIKYVDGSNTVLEGQGDGSNTQQDPTASGQTNDQKPGTNGTQSTNKNNNSKPAGDNMPTQPDQSLSVKSLKDIKGKTIVYASPGQYFRVAQDEKDDKENPLSAKAQAQRNKVKKVLADIQKKYDFKLEYKRVGLVDVADKLQVAVSAGSKFADFMVPTIHQTNYMIPAKTIRDLNQFPEFQLSNDKIWNQHYRELSSMYGKNMFGIAANDFPEQNLLYFNKRILKEDVGVEPADLYKMVRDGKWTITTMQRYSSRAKKTLVAGGDAFQQQWGLCGPDMRGSVSTSIYYSSGGKAVTKNPDGSYKNVFDQPESMAALNTVKRWLLGDSSVFNPKEETNDTTVKRQEKLFTEGRALFMSVLSSTVPKEGSTVDKDGWGILPMPKVDQKSDYVTQITHQALCYCVPVNNSRDEIALVGHLLAELIPQLNTIREENRQENSKRIKTMDPDAYEMLTKYVEPKGLYAPPNFGGAGEVVAVIHQIMMGGDPASIVKRDQAQYIAATLAWNKALRDAK